MSCHFPPRCWLKSDDNIHSGQGKGRKTQSCSLTGVWVWPATLDVVWKYLPIPSIPWGGNVTARSCDTIVTHTWLCHPTGLTVAQIYYFTVLEVTCCSEAISRLSLSETFRRIPLLRLRLQRLPVPLQAATLWFLCPCCAFCRTL